MNKLIENARLNVLVVSAGASTRSNLSSSVESSGHHVICVGNPEDALVEASEMSPDAVLLDSQTGNATFIESLLAECPWSRVILVSARPSITAIVEAMRNGAYDVVQQPFTPEEINQCLERACRPGDQSSQPKPKEGELGDQVVGLGGTSDSPAMRRLLAQARQVAATDAAVLLRGEHGTGKTLLARAIHQWSGRRTKQLGVVSCPSLSLQLLESELFGHVKGAFTGAFRDKAGRVEQCNGGTLLLDEIGDLPIDLQPKLLRFVQDAEYERVGDAHTRRADVRLITATNVDLGKAVRDCRFREDLLYRLNVIELSLPSLRERREDIPALAKSILASMNSNGRRLPELTPAASDAMTDYDWPGNVRELRNAIERAIVFCKNGHIGPEVVPNQKPSAATVPRAGDPLSLAKLEEHHIRRILASAKSLREAARILQIDETTLWRRRKSYGI